MYDGNIREAENAFTSLIKLQPENPTGYYRLGILEGTQKQYDQAMANFQKALSINPSLIDVFARVISLHIVKKEFDTALSKCDDS